MSTRPGLRVALLAVAVATIGCDRLTKHAATAVLAGAPGRSYLADTIRLEYAENTGGFLSLGAQAPHGVRTLLFTIGTGFMLLALVRAAVGLRWRGWRLLGVGLVVAGGVSNWVDRIVHGSVVDFINVGIGPLRTGIFNVADVAIMLGAGTLVFSASVSKERQP